jgi:hypothetical protein
MKSEIESLPTPTPASPPEPKKRRKPSPEPPGLSHDERFWQAYLAALRGVASQFEQPRHADAGAYYPKYGNGGKEELTRSKDLVRRAWNMAVYSCQMFERQEEADQFNEKVGA